jgi:ferredoxin
MYTRTRERESHRCRLCSRICDSDSERVQHLKDHGVYWCAYCRFYQEGKGRGSIKDQFIDHVLLIHPNRCHLCIGGYTDVMCEEQAAIVASSYSWAQHDDYRNFPVNHIPIQIIITRRTRPKMISKMGVINLTKKNMVAIIPTGYEIFGELQRKTKDLQKFQQMGTSYSSFFLTQG